MLFGKTSTSSWSNRPVIDTLLNVRYAATTPSSFPDLHSSMNSCLFLACGSTSSAIEESEFHASFALSMMSD